MPDPHIPPDLQLDDTLRLAITDPGVRKTLYARLPNEPRPEHRELLLALFDEEMKYRDTLWQGSIDDDGDDFENIYECAFLLYKLGNPTDVFLLWKAKRLNMDVGSSFGAQYFVGAGIEQTLRFLEGFTNAQASAIHAYVSSVFSMPGVVSDQAEWEAQQLRYFDRAPDRR